MLKILNKSIVIVISILSVLLFTSCELTSVDENEKYIDVVEVLNDNAINNQGCLVVTGDVKNISEYNVKHLEIIVTFYNDSGEEIATSTEVSDDILLPNEMYHFNITCLKKDTTSCNIQVIPEIEYTPRFWNILN